MKQFRFRRMAQIVAKKIPEGNNLIIYTHTHIHTNTGYVCQQTQNEIKLELVNTKHPTGTLTTKDINNNNKLEEIPQYYKTDNNQKPNGNSFVMQI